jgi:putative tricarboxylic transport membrane protein
VNGRAFDIAIMFVFGIIGYGMKKVGVAAPPLVLGLILGLMAEENFRRAMISADFSFVPFFTRPISLILVILIVFIILNQNSFLTNNLKKGWKKLKS